MTDMHWNVRKECGFVSKLYLSIVEYGSQGFKSITAVAPSLFQKFVISNNFAQLIQCNQQLWNSNLFALTSYINGMQERKPLTRWSALFTTASKPTTLTSSVWSISIGKNKYMVHQKHKRCLIPQRRYCDNVQKLSYWERQYYNFLRPMHSMSNCTN